MFSTTIKHIANYFGIDIVRTKNSPRMTWLGLRGRNIRYIIDVGANIGQFAMEAHGIFPGAEFICFEPIPEVANSLEANIAANNIRARIERLALSDFIGKATFNLHIDHSPSSSLLKTTAHTQDLYPQIAHQRGIEVALSTLDVILKEHDLTGRNEILLKLDAQGNESKIISGAQRSLSFIDHVITEVNIDLLFEGQASYFNIHQEMCKYGFHYAGALQPAYAENGHLVFFDALFTKVEL